MKCDGYFINEEENFKIAIFKEENKIEILDMSTGEKESNTFDNIYEAIEAFNTMCKWSIKRMFSFKQRVNVLEKEWNRDKDNNI